MAKTTRDTIITIETGIQYEAVAHAALTPGHLVELLATGKVQKQATAGADCEIAVAIEDYLQGRTIADEYAADDRVLYRVFPKGAQILLVLADGENIVVGDKLTPATGGEVKAVDSTDTRVKFIAMEAVNASAGSVPVAQRRVVGRVL